MYFKSHETYSVLTHLYELHIMNVYTFKYRKVGLSVRFFKVTRCSFYDDLSKRWIVCNIRHRRLWTLDLFGVLKYKWYHRALTLVKLKRKHVIRVENEILMADHERSIKFIKTKISLAARIFVRCVGRYETRIRARVYTSCAMCIHASAYNNIMYDYVTAIIHNLSRTIIAISRVEFIRR